MLKNLIVLQKKSLNDLYDENEAYRDLFENFIMFNCISAAKKGLYYFKFTWPYPEIVHIKTKHKIHPADERTFNISFLNMIKKMGYKVTIEENSTQIYNSIIIDWENIKKE